MWGAGMTVDFLMVVFLTGYVGFAWAAEDHKHHVHGAAPASVATQEKPQSKAAYPPPTAEEMAAAFPDMGGMSMQDHMGSSHFSKLMLDRLEWQEMDDEGALAWEGNVSWGSELNRLWFSSEGEREDGRIAHVDNRLYGSHAFARWWEATAGLRQLGGEGPDRTFAGVGVQGLVPYFFELDASLWLGEGGRSALAVEAEYEMRLSNRLILQPRLEMNAWGKDDAAKGIGNGLSDAELGFRLRYEIRRELAPYLGVEWAYKFGDTADYAGGDARDFRVVAGLRIWL